MLMPGMKPSRHQGKIVRIEAEYGLGFVRDSSTGSVYPFRFDKILGYRGEAPSELGLFDGASVEFDLADERISHLATELPSGLARVASS